MRSTAVCVDANIVVRLVAPDPNRDVLALWQEWRSQGMQLYAPTLLRFEVANAFHRMRLAGNVDDDLASGLLALALDLPIGYVSEPWLHQDALALAGRFGLKAAYHAHYVALAQNLGAELWTADKRLFNALHPHAEFIRLVDGA